MRTNFDTVNLNITFCYTTASSIKYPLIPFTLPRMQEWCSRCRHLPQCSFRKSLSASGRFFQIIWPSYIIRTHYPTWESKEQTFKGEIILVTRLVLLRKLRLLMGIITSVFWQLVSLGTIVHWTKLFWIDVYNKKLKLAYFLIAFNFIPFHTWKVIFAWITRRT